MATLLRLGRRVINIDMVCDIEDYDDRIRLFYAASSTDSAGVQQQAYAEIEGVAAEALRSWLAEHAIQLVADQQESARERPAGVAASERARLLQAAAAAGASQPITPANDNPFYGAARLQQMHGVGSDTQPGTASENQSAE